MALPASGRVARAIVRRVSPEQADAELRAGALLIDIRPQGLRERDGVVPGSRIIDRNVLEWRCDPASPWRDPEVADPPGRQLIGEEKLVSPSI